MDFFSLFSSVQKFPVFVCAAIFLVLCPTDALAAFIRFPSSARVLSLGGASAALADDASAVRSNPAGMVQSDGIALACGYADIYAADGLYRAETAAVYARGASAWGISWEKLGLQGTYDEDVAAIAFARQISDSTSVGAAVSSYKSEVKNFTTPFYKGPRSAAGFALGVLWQISDDILAAAVADNINEPQLADGEKLAQSARLGLRYHPFASGLVTAEHETAGNVLRCGFEVVIGGMLPVRVGVERGRPTFGFGIETGFISIDFALLSDHNLGQLYQTGVRMKL
ncbi:MAG: hypothetical protein CVU77_01405 [Elusimicrobia bacterium HGW-Elusimicrobia-1]|jgi:hypothetical protein|nr:MAG: hypothetical protein CVU77_01405 [Elusimicrobia bacterium HGW-Elusimicrobia-1]